MKIYCSICDKVQPVNIDNCRDAKTNEPFQDIVCAECDLVIASGTGIAQQAAQDEPVAWMMPDGKTVDKWGLKFYGGVVGTPLYTHPPAREWVGLTDEEKADLFEGTAPYYNEADYADAIEAKLKEKNT